MTIYKDPTVKINQKITDYIPNSYSSRPGKPMRKYTPTVKKKVFTSEDVSEAISYVKFDMKSTDTNIKQFNEWVALGDNNVITEVQGDYNVNYEGMSIENPNADKDRGAEGNFTIEFKGKPATEN